MDIPNPNGTKSALQDPVTGRFLPGNPGGGRPKGTLSWASAIMKEAENQAATLADGTKVTKMDIVIKKLWELAQEGDMRAVEELGNRIDGRPKQSVDHTTAGEPLYLPSDVIKRYDLNDANGSAEENS